MKRWLTLLLQLPYLYSLSNGCDKVIHSFTDSTKKTLHCSFEVQPSKTEVYLGEGIHVIVAFNVFDDNKVPMNFYRVGTQLRHILNTIRPSTCWEENAQVDEIQPEDYQLRGKEWTRYKLYEGVFFPMNTGEVTFPSASLEMLDKSGSDTTKTLTFYSRTKKVKVKELPPHPLKGNLSVNDHFKLVGNFELVEDDAYEGKSEITVKTGDRFDYTFYVKGDGNLFPLRSANLVETPHLAFYRKQLDYAIKIKNGKATGFKAFTYSITPSKRGTYRLSDYISFVCFNPLSHRYQVLKPTLVLKAEGSSHLSQSIKEAKKGAAIIVAFDVSESMLLEDVVPNRLTALKEATKAFIKQTPSFRIGIALFAGKAIHYASPTADRVLLDSLINKIDTRQLQYEPGTALGDAIWECINEFKENTVALKKVIILCSDGDNSAGRINPRVASKLSKEKDIKIYTIGVGASGPAPYRSGKDDFNYVYDSLDESTLRTIAQATNGHYFNADNTEDIGKFYQTVLYHLERELEP